MALSMLITIGCGMIVSGSERKAHSFEQTANKNYFHSLEMRDSCYESPLERQELLKF
jgi:hypothetical protein